MLHLAHLVLGNPLPHALQDLFTLLALQVGVVAEVAESHTHALVLQLGIGDFDVVLRNSDAGAEVCTEYGDRLEELNFAKLVPDAEMFYLAQLLAGKGF